MIVFLNVDEDSEHLDLKNESSSGMEKKRKFMRLRFAQTFCQILDLGNPSIANRQSAVQYDGRYSFLRNFAAFDSHDETP